MAWPLGFIITALASNTISIFFVLMWGVRLFLYLGKRNLFSPEDSRYKTLRIKWGAEADFNAYKFIFIFQGSLMYILSFPMIFGKVNTDSFNIVNYIGAVVFLAGFSLESYADFFLKNFKEKNKGIICMSGPWKFCRFPNYLGEIILWYGIYLITFSEHNWWTVFAPILLNFLIIKLTGVAPIEEKYKKNEDYVNYAKHTPRLIFIKPIR